MSLASPSYFSLAVGRRCFPPSSHPCRRMSPGYKLMNCFGAGASPGSGHCLPRLSQNTAITKLHQSAVRLGRKETVLHGHSPGWAESGKDAVNVWREASCIHGTRKRHSSPSYFPCFGALLLFVISCSRFNQADAAGFLPIEGTNEAIDSRRETSE